MSEEKPPLIQDLEQLQIQLFEIDSEKERLLAKHHSITEQILVVNTAMKTSDLPSDKLWNIKKQAYAELAQIGVKLEDLDVSYNFLYKKFNIKNEKAKCFGWISDVNNRDVYTWRKND